MMARTQIKLDPEMQRRADDLGISLAQYVRQLVARDLDRPQQTANPPAVFDLGKSKQSDIANHKDEMIAAVFSAAHQQKSRR